MQRAVCHPQLRKGVLLGALVVGSIPARAEAPGETAVAARVAEERLVWVARPLTVVIGEKADVFVELQLPEGFHVYRDDIHLTVTDDGGLTLGTPKLPPAQAPRGDRGGPWYEHDVRLELPVEAVGITPGVRLLHLEAEVRGCSAKRCHAGTREDLEVYVQVVDRDEASCPR